MVLVDIGEDRKTVADVVRERRYDVPVLLDEHGVGVDRFGVRGTPTVILLDRDGRVRGRAIGPRPWTAPAGRALLESLLAEPKPR